MSVGNDVVDLADPETRLEGLHPRFVERVFTVAEREQLEASPARQALHWALWAAKESAYKAVKRLSPETVFSPREFAVELAPGPLEQTGLAGGCVRHRGRRLGLRLRLADGSVHAVAWVAGAPSDGVILWRTRRADGDPSLAARCLASTTIASALGLAPSGLGIAGRPPLASITEGRPAAEVSLSHHGRFVAFACRLLPLPAPHGVRGPVPALVAGP